MPRKRHKPAALVRRSGSIATDMTSVIIESEDLFYGVETFASMPEWGECYTRNGFQLAIQDRDVLRRVWKIEQKSNEGAAPWYPDAETMRYCFYSKPNVWGRAAQPGKLLTSGFAGVT